MWWRGNRSLCNESASNDNCLDVDGNDRFLITRSHLTKIATLVTFTTIHILAIGFCKSYLWYWWARSRQSQWYYDFVFSGCPTCWTETASAQGSFTFGPSFPPKDSLVPRKLPEPDILEELVHIIFEFLSFLLADILPAEWGRRKKLGLRHALATYVVGVCPSLTETLLSLPGQVKLSTGAHCWCWVRAWYVVVSKRAHILFIKRSVLPGHKLINAWGK